MLLGGGVPAEPPWGGAVRKSAGGLGSNPPQACPPLSLCFLSFQVGAESRLHSAPTPLRASTPPEEGPEAAQGAGRRGRGRGSASLPRWERLRSLQLRGAVWGRDPKTQRSAFRWPARWWPRGSVSPSRRRVIFVCTREGGHLRHTLWSLLLRSPLTFS